MSFAAEGQTIDPSLALVALFGVVSADDFNTMGITMASGGCSGIPMTNAPCRLPSQMKRSLNIRGPFLPTSGCPYRRSGCLREAAVTFPMTLVSVRFAS